MGVNKSFQFTPVNYLDDVDYIVLPLNNFNSSIEYLRNSIVNTRFFFHYCFSAPLTSQADISIGFPH